MSEEVIPDLKPSKLPDDPDGPGIQLRKARELRRFSLRDVAVQLHLRLDIIDAIENDNYAALPGSTFVRGYLRGYARLVGISEDNIIQSFNNLVGIQDSFVMTQPSRRSASNEKTIKRNAFISWLPYLFIFGSLGVLMGLYGDASIMWLRENKLWAPVVEEKQLIVEPVAAPAASVQDAAIPVPKTGEAKVAESTTQQPIFYKGLEVVPEETAPAETRAIEE